jgi:hypothetical protein
VQGLFRLWFLPFLILVLMGTLWSLATPIGAYPDEQAHIFHAVSAVRGEVLGKNVPGVGNGNLTEVKVPSTYAQINWQCFEAHPSVSASCQTKIKPSSKLVSVEDYTGRYPPFYDLIVGLPSLLTTKTVSVYLMRFMSTLLDAGFIALAFATARRWSRSRLLPAGLLVAATPMCVYFVGGINPNGFEIASAVAMWTAAVVLANDHLEAPPRSLVAVLGVSAIAVAFARGDSPLWLIVVAVALAPIWVRRIRMDVLRRRYVAAWIGVVAVGVVVAATWTLTAHALRVADPHQFVQKDFKAAVFNTIGGTPSTLNQEIGVFGWLDNVAPWITITGWYVLGGGSILIGAFLSSARKLLSLALTAVIALALPTAFTLYAWRQSGDAIALGRYYLPAAAGIPIVALGLLRTGRMPVWATRRLQLCIGATAAVSQFFAFFYALRRHYVGNAGPILGTGSLPASKVWNPPVDVLTLDALFLVACIAIVIVVQGWSGDSPASEEHEEPTLVDHAVGV